MTSDALDDDRLIADLDADQHRAVTTESRLVAVIAGAGSGKTRVLTRRVAWRVANGTADAAHTLVLTFTREATGELRRRLPRLGLSARVPSGTFHSVALQLLRQRWADLDRRAPELVPDRSRLLAQLAGASMGRRALDDGLLADVDWATTRGLDATAFSRAVSRGDYRPTNDTTRVAAMLDAYATAKRERRQIDLDDVLALAAAEIAGDPAYRAAIQWRYRHVLVDEAQDLNPLQHRLVAALAEPGDLFLVGDPAQAIYGFNGADPGLLLNVETHFPGIEVIRLPANHRSTPQVVDAGAHVLAGGAELGDLAAALTTTRPDGALVHIVAADDEVAEAQLVTNQLAVADPGLIRSGGVAVLARTHATLAPVAEALRAGGVAVRHAADGPDSPLTPLLRQAYRLRTAAELRDWGHAQLELAAEESGPDSPPAIVGRAALDFVLEQPAGDGAALRTWVDTTDPFGAETSGVELLTFHAAKGREWHTVVVVGCETSLVPHRSARTQLARAEEARLLYVAITRATDDLTVTWAGRRNGYQRKRSPFLDGFTSTTPPAVPPPPELRRARSDDDVLMQHLRGWRASVARGADLLPEVVCSDRTLMMIARTRPTSPEQLDAATGLGGITSRRLWPTLREVLSTTD
ncbi:MAG TPA: ATP-dependent DNA helicase UvrD2 [Ilumatobacter sp.]|nr:ATP-dependent DNA helicase UvrD2 [Ilumatobacter sp.]